MFKIVLSDNSLFKEAFESISHIIDEIVCIIDSEGFRVNAIDRGHICFVSFNLKYNVFDEFICDAPTKVAIDTNEFHKILKRMKKTDILTLESDAGNFIIKLDGDANREFKLRLIDVDYEIPEMPNIDYDVSIDVPSNVVNDALTDVFLFSEKADFMIDEDYLTIRTIGDFGDGEIKYLHGEEVNQVVKSIFDIRKLTDIFRASKFSNQLNMKLGNDVPITLTFTLPSGDGSIGFLLAPRLEQEED